jgi:Domain of unknown function (DUF4145)
MLILHKKNFSKDLELIVGKLTEKYEENKTKNELAQIQCIDCQKQTKHKVLQSIDLSASEDCGHYGSVQYWFNYQIVQCQGCDCVTFRKLEQCSEDASPDEYGNWELDLRETLYPKRSKLTFAVKNFDNLPQNLFMMYRETIECFNNDSFILTAAGLRALLEGLCAELKIKDGPKEFEKNGKTEIKRFSNLEGKFSGLHEKNFLTKQHSDALHEHRYLGNQAVHELAQPSRDELKLAIEIIEHTFESVYEIPEKADDLRRKRAKRNKSI